MKILNYPGPCTTAHLPLYIEFITLKGVDGILVGKISNDACIFFKFVKPSSPLDVEAF